MLCNIEKKVVPFGELNRKWVDLPKIGVRMYLVEKMKGRSCTGGESAVKLDQIHIRQKLDTTFC